MRRILATLFFTFTFLSSPSFAENLSLSEIKKAAEQGDASAQFKLAMMYTDGTGVPQDYKQAHNWFIKAAEQGNTNAQGSLGSLYSKGQGVRQDDQQALNWYTKAAEQGNVPLQYLLGTMYVYGAGGVRQNTATAKEWFGKACDNGDQGSCDRYRELNTQ